jgi:ammonia channel protein AmtB
MVGPSLSEEKRRVASRRLKLGFVALVGVSTGLVAVAGGATTVQVLVALAGGLAVGAALLWYLASVGAEWQASRRR